MSLILQSANIVPLIITIIKTKKPKWLNYRKMVSSSDISSDTLSDIVIHHRTLFFSDQRNCSNTKMKQIMFVLRFMVFYSSDVWLLAFCPFFGTFKLEETRFHFTFYFIWCPLSIVPLPVSIKGAKSSIFGVTICSLIRVRRTFWTAVDFSTSIKHMGFDITIYVTF